MAEGKKKQQHIVVFRDEKGNVLKTSFIPHGGPAEPPTLPERRESKGHYEVVFGGWDRDLSSVTENLVVTASYKKVPKKYLVMYFNDDGSVFGTEIVPYGSPAEAKDHPVKVDTDEFHYPFIGWDKDLTLIEKDTMAKPVFGKIRRSWPVRFLDDQGRVLAENRVFYGRAASPPPEPVRHSDEVYDYAFAGWDQAFDEVRGPLEIRPLYESIFREYPVTIYEEDRLVSEKNYHYHDRIEYPSLSRKGYRLTWTPEPDLVTGPATIRGSWEFANPAGREVCLGGTSCRIVNPSISQGTVCLLSYESSDRHVRIPEQVLIGDYYYKISEIGSRAFAGCLDMEILDLPSSVAVLREEAVSGCRKLKEIRLGRGIRIIGKHAFSENTRLKTIILDSDRIRQVHRSAFERMDTPVTLMLRPPVYQKRFSLFEKAIGSGAVIPGKK